VSQILHGDCREIMLSEGPFDMIAADPPYGDTSLLWDKQVDGWHKVALATLKPTGSMWLFGSMRSLLAIAPGLLNDWSYAQDIVWEKHNGSGFHADRFKRVHEHALQFYRRGFPWRCIYNDVQTTPDATARTVRRKRRPPHTGHIEAGSYASQDGGPRIMRSVILMPSCHGHAIHPTEKPVDLLQILIRTSCPTGGLVGDFFAGSGAAAEAADATGRNYVGCEIDAEMVGRARRRSLFVVTMPPQPEPAETVLQKAREALA
jgi:site-specific DNA-methyltransferase (adenine-specific)